MYVVFELHVDEYQLHLCIPNHCIQPTAKLYVYTSAHNVVMATMHDVNGTIMAVV